MKAFQREQFEFARALRQPSSPPPAGVDASRMAVYQRLVFNNIDALLARAVPITYRLLSASSKWEKLVKALLEDGYQLQSPYFSEVSSTLVALLAEPNAAVRGLQLPPYSAELAHYEWLELQAELADADPSPVPVAAITTLPPSQLLVSRIIVTPTLQLGHYHWPVMKISPQPEENRALLAAGPSAARQTIAVYRDRQESARFTALNTTTAALVELLVAKPQWCLAQQLAALLEHAPSVDLATLKQHAPALITELAETGLVTGAITLSH
jgi:hypothetical protein